MNVVHAKNVMMSERPRNPETPYQKVLDAAYGICINVLNEKIAIDDPKPMTVDDLNNYIGNPVYVFKPKFKNGYWAILIDVTAYDGVEYFLVGVRSKRKMYESIFLSKNDQGDEAKAKIYRCVPKAMRTE